MAKKAGSILDALVEGVYSIGNIITGGGGGGGSGGGAGVSPVTFRPSPVADYPDIGVTSSSRWWEEDAKVVSSPAPSQASGGGATSTSGGATAAGSSGYFFPVAYANSTFSDTYGAPRSGGRKHKGVDIFAPRGTSILAVTSGKIVSLKTRSLGGKSFYLKGDDGKWYYYAHLDGYNVKEGDTVSAGAVIGYLGDTGNAKGGTPHLHFEIKARQGGGWQNPTPTVKIWQKEQKYLSQTGAEGLPYDPVDPDGRKMWMNNAINKWTVAQIKDLQTKLGVTVTGTWTNETLSGWNAYWDVREAFGYIAVEDWSADRTGAKAEETQTLLGKLRDAGFSPEEIERLTQRYMDIWKRYSGGSVRENQIYLHILENNGINESKLSEEIKGSYPTSLREQVLNLGYSQVELVSLVIEIDDLYEKYLNRSASEEEEMLAILAGKSLGSLREAVLGSYTFRHDYKQLADTLWLSFFRRHITEGELDKLLGGWKPDFSTYTGEGVLDIPVPTDVDPYERIEVSVYKDIINEIVYLKGKRKEGYLSGNQKLMDWAAKEAAKYYPQLPYDIADKLRGMDYEQAAEYYKGYEAPKPPEPPKEVKVELEQPIQPEQPEQPKQPGQPEQPIQLGNVLEEKKRKFRGVI